MPAARPDLSLRLAAVALHVEGDGAGARAPDVVTVIPARDGEVAQGRDGRAFTADHQTVIARHAAHGMDLCMDWEHASERWDVERAPAAGWISDLHVDAESGHLMGRIAWTEEGARDVASRAYRYTSPAIVADDDRRVVQVVSVGLTNRPNLHVPSLNRSAQTMTIPAKILETLELNTSAGEADVLDAIGKLRDRAPDPEKWAPRADVIKHSARADKLEAELHALKGRALDDEIEHALDDAAKAGKIAPASRELHKAQITGNADPRKGLEIFRKLVGLAPAIVDENTQGRSATAEDKVSTHANKLAAEEARRAGLKPETVAKLERGEI